MTRIRIVIAALALAIVIAVAAWILVDGGAAGTDAVHGDPGAVSLGSGDSAHATSAPGARLGGAASSRAIISTPFKDEPETQPVGAWVVTGRVVNESGDPVAGVTVTIGVSTATNGYVPPGGTFEATSAVDGSFACAVALPEQAKSLVANVASDIWEAKPVSRQTPPGAPPPEPIVLSVMKCTRLVVGTVTDTGGRPISGASVGSSYRKFKTNADGAYRYPTAQSPTVRLLVAASGFGPKSGIVQAPRPGGTVTLDFTLAPEGVVDGVVRREDNTPVAGASVWRWPRTEGVVTTDKDGAFRLTGFNTDESANSVEGRAPGFVTGTCKPRFIDRHAHVDLVLRRGVAVAGVVVSSEGQPLSGASVTIGDRSNSSSVWATTGRDGRFVADGALPGTSTITVVSAGFVTHTETLELPPAGSAPLELRIVLATGHHIAGRVVDVAGKPVAGANVGTERISDGGNLDPWTTTAADGHFRVDGLPAEGVSLRIDAEKYLHAVIPCALDRDNVVVVLTKSGRLAGQIVDGVTREPLKRFTVRIVAPEMQPGDRAGGGHEGAWGASAHQFDVADGIWRADDEKLAVGGVCGIEVRADGYATGTLTRLVVSLEPDPATNVLALLPESTVSGVVVTRGGDVVAHAAVAVLSPAQRHRMIEHRYPTPPRDVETNDTGAFAVKGVAAGEFFVLVNAAGLPTTWAGPFPIAAGQAVSNLRIVVPDGGTITGVVVGPDGAPLVGARVQVEGVALLPGFQSQRTPTGADGRFTFRGLPAGTLRVAYLDRETWVALVERTVTLAAGQTQDVRLAFEGVCSVRVVVDGDAPLPPQFVVSVQPVVSAAGAGVAPVTTGATPTAAHPGRSALCRGTSVTLGGLDPGVHTVSARGWGTAQNRLVFGEAPVTLAPGATAEVHIRVQREKTKE